ncbi:MAG: radical SAM protein [Candidatus Omnitrophota bacterium]
MKVLTLIPPSKHSKNVARDLVYGCWCKGKRIAGIQFPPVSQLLVTTVLRESGHDAHLLDGAGLRYSINEIKTIVDKEQYDVCTMLTSTMTIQEDAEILFDLKQANPKMTSIVMGSQPTFMPQATLARRGIDFIVMKEQEHTLKNLLAALEAGGEAFKNVRGIGYKNADGQAVINPPAEMIKNLDELPIANRTLLPQNIDYFNPIVKRMPFTTMFTTRGCTAKCTYCTSPGFYGEKVRFRSAEKVLEEMEYCQNLGYKEIFFRDELFTASKKRVLEICSGIKDRGIDLTWICSSRVNNIDAEMLKIMKDAGCHLIRFGVESGVQEILDNVRKDITVEETRQAFKLCHEFKIDTHAHCMIGSPGETKETINQSIQFVKEIDPTIITFGITTPYPGTHLFDEVKEVYPEIGDGSQMDISRLHSDSFFNQFFTDLTNEDLTRDIRRVYREFYFRPRYIWGWLKRIDSWAELKRVTLAGANVVDFSLSWSE